MTAASVGTCEVAQTEDFAVAVFRAGTMDWFLSEDHCRSQHVVRT
jgi:hypothetical protein